MPNSLKLAGIDTNLVVALHALLSEKNVTRAARRLGLGQSATSHALARLRAHFDDPLLVRSGRELVLSERARRLVASAAAAVAGLESVFLSAASETAASRGFDPATSRRVFHIAATDNLELYVLPRLTTLLAREAPHVDLRFHHLPPDWRAALGRGDFELKLGRKQDLRSAALRSEDLFTDHVACVVRRRHLLAKKRSITLKQYATLSHILIAPGETARGMFMDDVLAEHGLERRIAITLPHFLVALFAVGGSDHALTIPSRLVEAAKELHLSALRLPVPARVTEYTLSQVWTVENDTDEGLRWLRRLVLSCVSDYRRHR